MKNRVTLPIQNKRPTNKDAITEITLINLGTTNPVGRATALLSMASSIARTPTKP